MNLFIIGNGFDLAHGLKTRYENFRDYLEETDGIFLESLEEMYGYSIGSSKELIKNYLWQDFESNLSRIDEISIIEQGEDIELGLELEDIGVEDTLNLHWESQYKFIKELNEYIMKWIKGINIDDVQKNTDFINSEDLFITFNYTLLLEEVYGISKYNVLHIHGSIDEDDILPVIGHGDKEKIIEMREIAENFREKFKEKQSSIYNAIGDYYKRTLKDVNFHISDNDSFFRRLIDVNSISIIGHSLGDVDMPYFKKIFDSVSKDTVWNIYLHNAKKEDIDKCKEKIMSIGVKKNKINIFDSNTFFERDAKDYIQMDFKHIINV